MNLSRRAIVFSALASIAACSREQPVPAKPVADAPASAAAPAAVPAADPALGAAIRAALGMPGDAYVFDATVDLNGDGEKEIVAYVAGPDFCGTGGCPLFVFANGIEGYRLIADVSIVRPPVHVASQSSNGWRTLVVGVGGGGLPAGNAALDFDGASYPSNPTSPPARPLADLAGTELLIKQFTTMTDGWAVPAAVYGDENAPIAAEVFGMPIRTGNAEELRYVALDLLTRRYAAQHGVAVTNTEAASYAAKVQSALAADPDVSGASEPESAQDKAVRLQIAAAFVQQWKLNRELYREFGGRVGYQQGGPEPLDAYRKFLEASVARGDLKFVSPELEQQFWKYYRDDSLHEFYPAGSAEEKKAFATPPY